MRLTLPVPALIGGVSTQPEANRLPQQAELSENALGSIVEGLHRRPPAEHLHTLPILAEGVQHTMTLQEGSYLLSTDGSTEFRVYDVESGSAQTVLNKDGVPLAPSDLAYLGCENPRQDLRFLTLSDYTLILNRTAVVAQRPLSAPRLSQTLVRITQGSYRSRYTLRVSHNGATVVEVVVESYASDGSPPGSNAGGNAAEAETSVRTDVIAKEMASMAMTGAQTTGLAASFSQVTVGAPLGPSGLWNIDTSGSTIRIQRLDGTDFDVSVDESIGQSSMTVVGKQVQLFSDLPKSAPHRMLVEVVGDPDQSDASYWAKFQANDPNTAVNAWAEGYWEESLAPQVSYG
ncbi:MAG: hypothetical protein H6590_06230, partial [Flavobacteriales bacterium]|nr:hypothetical protein [Flavobacteriales bacterium]